MQYGAALNPPDCYRFFFRLLSQPFPLTHYHHHHHGSPLPSKILRTSTTTEDGDYRKIIIHSVLNIHCLQSTMHTDCIKTPTEEILHPAPPYNYILPPPPAATPPPYLPSIPAPIIKFCCVVVVSDTASFNSLLQLVT